VHTLSEERKELYLKYTKGLETELRNRAKHQRRKTKAMVQNKRRRRISKIFTIKDHDIEVVRSFIYLWTVINNANDEMIIKAIILPANKAYSSL
jgi:hypothetical protein